MLDHEVDDAVEPLAARQIGEAEGTGLPHARGIPFHDVEIDADIWREVGLVDDEEVGSGDPRASLAGISSP